MRARAAGKRAIKVLTLPQKLRQSKYTTGGQYSELTNQGLGTGDPEGATLLSVSPVSGGNRGIY